MPTVTPQKAMVLVQLDESGEHFALLQLVVAAGDVLVSDVETLTQTLTTMQHSQAETQSQNLRTMTDLTNLKLQLAQAGIIPEPIEN